METEDVARNTVDSLGDSEPFSLAGGGRSEIFDSGQVGSHDVEHEGKTLLEEAEHEESGLGATSIVVSEGDDEKREEVGTIVQCTVETVEEKLEVEQMPSGGVTNVVQEVITDTLITDTVITDIVITDTVITDTVITDTVTKDAESEAKDEAQAGGMAGENLKDSLSMDAAKDAAADISLPAEDGAGGLGETQSLQVDPAADLSKESDMEIDGTVKTGLDQSTEPMDAQVCEEPLLESAQTGETTTDPDGTMSNVETLAVVQESRKEAPSHKIASSNIAEVLAAGVAAGVAEGIAESIAETIAKETAGSYGQGSSEGRLFDSGRFERMAIAKAVAEVIAESVAHEVAQGLADGLAEAAATAEALNRVEKRKPDNIEGITEENKEGVLCECGLVAVVRVVGEKSPNRGLRYLMCSLQEPSFFKRKGKRKESDTIGKCKFFSWLDPPRHPSKEDKKNQEKVKAQLEDFNASHLTRSSAKKSGLDSPTAAGTRPSGEGEEISPYKFSTPRDTDDDMQLSEVPESTPETNAKPARVLRKKGPAEEFGKDDVLSADRPTSAGTLTRSALRKGGPEPAPERSMDTSVVSTPASTLGKRTIDWTDCYVGPEAQVFEKGATWRKRRSVRGESGPSSRYPLAGSGSGRNTGFGSSEKKPLQYFRRSTGQIGASDNETLPLVNSLNTVTNVESAGAVQQEEKDNRFKSYYKKNKVGSSSEPKIAKEISLLETDKKTKSQTRRQQRKLPLSEVYGAIEPLVPARATRKGTNINIGNDNSLSPSGQSIGKSTPSDVASDPKESSQSKSPPKKRKLSWVLSEDSVLRETDSPKRTSARKSISGALTDPVNQILSSSVLETPLLACVFPTVRYEAKLPAEDYHDPDDPWSLEIPWVKQEQQAEEAQQVAEEKEIRKDEQDMETEEGDSIAMKTDEVTTIEAVNEAAVTEEELPTMETNVAESLSVSEPGDHVAPGPASPDMTLNEAEGKDHVTQESHVDEENINLDTPLVDAVGGGEDASLACDSQAGGAHPIPDQEVGDVLKEDPVDTQHGVLHDDQNFGDKTQTSMLAAQTGTSLEADGHESFMNETTIMNVPGSIDESDHDKTDTTASSEQLASLEGVEIFSHNSSQSVDSLDQVTEDAINHENNPSIGRDPTVSKDSPSKLDNTLETDIILPSETCEPPGILHDAEQRELVLSGDEPDIEPFQESIKGTYGLMEEPAVSGSNLIGDGGPDARVGQVSSPELERDLAQTHPDQDAAFKSPRETDHAGAAAASENAGFVNSVWRLASGKKTRSIGSIGAPAVTSKRSRSLLPSPKGGPRQQVEIQWVDVPLDWRNEKSTGRVPLLPRFPGKGLNGSDTSQSDFRLLQSGDTSQGTHSARPRLARGEVDDSSIVTDEQEKEHEAYNEHSLDFNAELVNGVSHARQATLGNMEMDNGASIPSGEHYVGDPTAVFAGGENAVKRKRGRPRKDSKKPVGLHHPSTGGLKPGALVGVTDTPEPVLGGVVGKADGEPSSMLICSTAMEGNTVTESHGEDRVSQLERSASNTERENGKPEGDASSAPEGGETPLSGFPGASTEGLPLDIVPPYCSCKVAPRQATLRFVTRSGDPNEGLRYWGCINNRKLFPKKRKSPSQVSEERCNFFRWLDTPRVTAKEKREARKERYRQVELQRLL